MAGKHHGHIHLDRGQLAPEMRPPTLSGFLGGRLARRTEPLLPGLQRRKRHQQGHLGGQLVQADRKHHLHQLVGAGQRCDGIDVRGGEGRAGLQRELVGPGGHQPGNYLLGHTFCQAQFAGSERGALHIGDAVATDTAEIIIDQL